MLSFASKEKSVMEHIFVNKQKCILHLHNKIDDSGHLSQTFAIAAELLKP